MRDVVVAALEAFLGGPASSPEKAARKGRGKR
jgi:hypothetical protein